MNEIIIIVRGGLVQGAYANNKNIKVNVLDYDNLEVETDQELIDEAKELQAKIENMVAVY
jgi:hypothetical protein